MPPVCCFHIHSVWLLIVGTIQESCCSANLMDTDGRAMVEAGAYSTLPKGRYRAMALKFCFDATVLAQLWTQVTESTYTLYKQWTFTLTENNPQYVIVSVCCWPAQKNYYKFHVHAQAMNYRPITSIRYL